MKPNLEIKLNNNEKVIVGEFTPRETEIGVLTNTDPDDPLTYSYSLISGTGSEDNSKFIIDGNKLKLNFVPDYEKPEDRGDVAGNNTYSIRIKSDNGEDAFEKVFVIEVKNIYKEIVKIKENIPQKTIIGSFNIPNQLKNFALVESSNFIYLIRTSGLSKLELVEGVGDGDNSKFIIDGNKLKLNFVPDYENPEDRGGVDYNNVYFIRVRAKDNKNNTYEKVFVIIVENIKLNILDIVLKK